MNWRAWPRAARWGLAYAAAVMVAVVGGAWTVGIGNAIFALGAALILASVWAIRAGGPRTTVVARDITGRPQRAPLPPEARAAEIRRGVVLFFMGIALWAPLAIRAWT